MCTLPPAKKSDLKINGGGEEVKWKEYNVALGGGEGGGLVPLAVQPPRHRRGNQR